MRAGAQALDAQPHAAAAGAEVQHRRAAFARQPLRALLHQQFGVRPGAEHAGAHRQLKVQEGPAAQNVLQGLPGGAAGGEFLQPGQGGLVQRRVLPAPALPCLRLDQRRRVEGGVLHARGLQPPAGLVKSLPRPHHLASSGWSGRTGVTAAMATSIMESSGSKVVSRWSHRPGALMMRVKRLS